LFANKEKQKNEELEKNICNLRSRDLIKIAYTLDKEIDHNNKNTQDGVIEDGRESRIEIEKVLIADTFIWVLSVFIIGLSVLEYQIEFKYQDRSKNENEKILKPLLAGILVVNICLCIINVYRKIIYFRYYKLRCSY
jgi:hypothetical protein